MRITIEIDDELLAEAMRATGRPTKKAAVEEALRTVVRLERQREALRKLGGVGWEGDLDAMREARSNQAYLP
jgi:Arc/MetJ family transcription regulator